VADGVGPGSSTVWRVALLTALVAVVAVALAYKPSREASPEAGVALATSHASPTGRSAVPRLVDLGADRCIPCKAMAPILEGLRTEYEGRMRVEFIDVWKDPEAGDTYRVSVIPTQIFFSADGRELARHQGFMSKADILAMWTRLGYDFSRPRPTAPVS
jgi:thioredoxin 1